MHLLAERGARWAPTGRDEVNAVRRALLKLKPEYTTEFVGIMAHYRACARESLDALLRTQTLKAHAARFGQRIAQLLASLP